MSASAHATPRAAALLAHLNLLLMAVGAACVWQGAKILREPLPSLPGQLAEQAALGRLQTGAGGVLLALGGAHWLLAHLALAAAFRPSAGLFISYAALAAALCCGEAGWLAWSLTRLRSLSGDPAAAHWLRPFSNLSIVFGLFFSDNRERLERATRADPAGAYLTLGGALALPLLQLAAGAAALWAARACRRLRETCRPRSASRPASRHAGRDSFQYHRYGDAGAPPQYQ